jgi:hypothetical protein
MPNAKDIGRDVNQILGGIGSVVAGMFLGPAGASGVQMAANGVDRLVDHAVPDEPPPPPKGSKPAEPVAPTPPRPPEAAAPPAPEPPPAAAPPGSVQSTVELLRAAGWDPSEVLAALRGPEKGRSVLAMSSMTVEPTRGGSEGGALRNAGAQEVVRMNTGET